VDRIWRLAQHRIPFRQYDQQQDINLPGGGSRISELACRNIARGQTQPYSHLTQLLATTQSLAILHFMASNGNQSSRKIKKRETERERERKQGSVLVCRVAAIAVVTVSIGVPPDRSGTVFC
jgi:hypothetical protein